MYGVAIFQREIERDPTSSLQWGLKRAIPLPLLTRGLATRGLATRGLTRKNVFKQAIRARGLATRNAHKALQRHFELASRAGIPIRPSYLVVICIPVDAF